MRIELPNDIRKILVIKLRAIGDVLLSTIVLKNLRHHCPEAQIDFLTEPPSREVLEGNPSVSSLIVFDRKKNSSAGVLLQLRRNRYELVIDLFCNPRTALMTYASGAKYRVGFSFRNRRYAYNILVPSRAAEIHNAEFNLDALRAVGVPIVSREIQFYTSSSDEKYVNEFLWREHLEEKRLIALNPSGSWYTKRWSLSKFAKLGDALARTYKAQVILLWGPGERNDAERIQKMMSEPAVLLPPTTLKQLGALLKKCAFLVSNDAGPMHLAAVLGVPTLGIYGPTNPFNQGPLGDNNHWVRLEGLDCLGCNLTVCPIGHVCMERLSVEGVMEGVGTLLKKHQIFQAA